MFEPKTITHNQNSLILYPERGGIITSIKIRDIELLYQGMLDEALHDITKSVRGGIPILFPNAGFLTDEEKIESGWSLPQHGFARTNEWKVIENKSTDVPVILTKEESAQEDDKKEQILRTSVGQKSQILQSLSSSDIPNMFGYEWQGSIENNITLSDEGIELRYSIANNSDKELPISLGLHPYWNVPFGDKSQIQWNFAGGDIIVRDIDNWSRGGTTCIDTPDDGIVKFAIPGVGTIEMQLPPEFRRLWIWSLSDKNFVCVEPVMGDDGNVVRDPVKIPAGGKGESFVKIILR